MKATLLPSPQRMPRPLLLVVSEILDDNPSWQGKGLPSHEDLVLPALAVLTADHGEDVDVAGVRAPGRHLGCRQRLAIDHDWQFPGFVVSETADPEEGTQVSERGCKPGQVLRIRPGKQIDVWVTRSAP
jgi:hypothetical protein